MVISCSAIDCNSRQGTPGVSFHRFPSDSKLRNRWIAACRRRDWIPGSHARLCSKHFVKRKKSFNHCDDFVPTIFAFNPSPMKRRKEDHVQNLERLEKTMEIQDIEQRLETTGILQSDIKKIQESDSKDEYVTKILLLESEALRAEIAKIDFWSVENSGRVLAKLKESQ